MSLSASREKWKTVAGIVTRGHRVASGKAEDSPYPAGTIQLQKPFFKALGLDLSSCHGGTLNLSIHPYTFEMTRPRHTFRQVEWTPLHPPEDFSFSHCLLIVQKRKIPGWIYYPHPETKETHFQDPSVLEILAPYTDGIGYGDRIGIEIDPAEITLLPA